MKTRQSHFHTDRPVSRIRLLLACVAIVISCTSLLAQTPSSPTKHFPKPDRVRYDGYCLTIDGKDTFIRSAAFHYFRTPRELWRGFGMPAHAEMASPIRPAGTTNVTLICELPNVPVIRSGEEVDCRVEAARKQFPDAELKKSPGNW